MGWNKVDSGWRPAFYTTNYPLDYKEEVVGRVQFTPQSQGCALLTGEREEDFPFSIQLKGIEPLDDIGRLLDSLRFEHRRKLAQLGIEIGSFDYKKQFGTRSSIFPILTIDKFYCLRTVVGEIHYNKLDFLWQYLRT